MDAEFKIAASTSIDVLNKLTRIAAIASIDAAYKLNRFWLDLEYEQASNDVVRQEVLHKIELLNFESHDQLAQLGV